MSIRLIACDLDGTLLLPDGHVRRSTAETLRQLHERGILVVLATGRSWRTTLAVQRELGIRGPFVAHNGAYAYDSRTERELYGRRVPRTAVEPMLRWARTRDISLRCYLGVGRPVWFNRFVEDHRHYMRPEDRENPALAEALDEDPVEMFLRGSWEVDSFLQRFGTRGPGYEAVAFLLDQPVRTLSICPPGVDKVEGIAAVARRFHIAPEAVLVIGDGQNDLRLMKWAGKAVAMGRGHEDAKAAADWVTDPEDPDPVESAVAWGLGQGAPPSARARTPPISP